LEAHACGRPVIASNLDGIPEAWAIGNLGHLVSAGNADDLARAMIRQAEGSAPSTTEQAQAHSRIQAQASLPVQARKFADLYRRLMAGRGNLR
jgi:glycosyltransferase involved in cell wall biosynthesis